MLKRFIGVPVLALSMTALAFAVEQGTFITRDGQRHTGELVFHGGHAYNLIDDNLNLKIGAQEQSFALNQVVVIDFVGGTPPTREMDAIPSNGHLIALRNGALEHGHFVNIVRGETVLWQKADGSTQEYPVRDVSRIYLSPDADRVAYNYNHPATPAVGTAGQMPAVPGAVQVLANRAWTDTGITVRKGDQVAFRTTGQIAWGKGPDQTAGPDGNGSSKSPASPVPDMPVGGLIGKVDNSAPFPIGSNTEPITMPAKGRLMLGVNANEFGENSGAFSVVITKSR